MKKSVLSILNDDNYQYFRDIIVSVINQGQEEDVKPYTWGTIPFSLKLFWINKLTNN